MTLDTPCPDDEGLRRLVLGLSDWGETADLEAHFAGCTRCAARAGGLTDAGDALLLAVRTGAVGIAVPAVRADVLERLGRLRAPADDVRPGEAVGAYRIEAVLGRGGMGVVYLARHARLSRLVAVKVLPPGAGADQAARFRRETETVATFRHPNVIQIHEVGEADGRQFLVMELADGGSLADRLAEAVLPPAEAVRLVEPLAQAVGHAHARGIIHRDLKPSNVLLMIDGTPKVSDFGLAKLLDGGDATGRTETGAVLGTPGYMSPEQATGGAAVGPAADVYGLGAILYECLTGRPPFKGETILETLDQVRARDPVPPRQFQPTLPRDLETVCLKCLEKDPARRYQSAAALAADLGRFLRGEPVLARPAGPGRRVWKWARRRPALAAMTAFSVMAALAMATLAAYYTAQLRDAAIRANSSAEEARRERAVAANNYRSAQASLRRMLSRFGGRAAEIPRLQELRQEQLEDALVFYQKILAGQDDPDPAIQLDAAVAGVEAGSIQFLLGRPETARDNLLRAAAILERLPEEYRTRPEAQGIVIQCFNYLANLPGTAADQVEKYLLQSHTTAEEFVRSNPSDPSAQNLLARTEHNLAALYGEANRNELAEKHHFAAVALRDKLIASYPQVDAYRADLGEDLINLGFLYSSTNRQRQAVDAFGRAEGLILPLVQTHPGDDEYKLSLAALYIDWGHVLRDRDLPAAIAQYDRAVELVDAVAQHEPRYLVARNRGVQAHGARAQARTLAGRLPEAIADWDRVIELADAPARVNYRAERGLVLVRAGQFIRAAGEAFELSAIPGLPGDHRYNLACVLALAVAPTQKCSPLGALAGIAAAELYATTALRLLQQLRTERYFDQPGKAKIFTEDPDLDGLRGRPDFRRLLDGLNAPPNS